MNRDDLRHLARRASISLVPAAHSVWIHGSLPSQFDAARRMLQGLAKGRPDLCMLFSSADPGTMSYLKACFPNDQASPLPLPARTVIRRFFRLTNPRLLVLLDGGRTLQTKSLRHTLEKNFPIVVINIGAGDEVKPLLIERAQQGDSLIRFCAKDEATAQQLLKMGVPVNDTIVTGSLDLEPDRPSQQILRMMVRQLLGLDDSTPLVVAGPVPADEVGLLLDAFALLRAREPLACLVVEPVAYRDSTTLLAELRRRGRRALRRVDPKQGCGDAAWDVLVAKVPGELPALFRGADATVAGGTFSPASDSGSLATALGAGCPVVVGRTHWVPARGGFTSSENGRVLAADASRLGVALCDALAGQRATRATDPIHPCQRPHRGAAQRTVQVIKPFLPTATPPGPEGPTWRVPTLRDGVSDGPVWGAIAPWLMKRRINDWDQLRERLRKPRSILCLGNGPSCEDPRLAEVEHDCLMRVNWRWRERGFLARPDVVFIGDFATVHKVSNCLFGIWNEFLEQRLLLRNLTRRGPRRIEYIAISRLPGVIQARRWSMRPSNGALMIVAAAALRPERITIGGMDLFAHPAGRYPSDIRARNEYARVHTRENELTMIDAALRVFPGEVTSLSDILQGCTRRVPSDAASRADSSSSVML